MRKLHQILHCQPQLLLVAALIGSVTPLSMLISFATPARVYAAETEEWRTINDITYMQDMTAEICDKSQVGDSKALKDKRYAGYTNDGVANSYIVKKLSDGKCWMTQNLNLVDKEITSADSNVVDDYTIPASAFWSNPSSSSNYQKQEGAYYNGGVNGAHYTWLTATAGTTNTGSTNATSDICPKGWRLPTGSASGEFQALYDQGSTKVGTWATNSTTAGYNFGNSSFSVNGNTVDGSAFFSAAGNVPNSSLGNVGSSGFYWSSTADGSTSAYRLDFNSSTVNPSNNGYRYNGFSVRCVNNPEVHSTNIPPELGSNQALIEVTVNPTLTLDVSGGSFSSQITPGQMVTGTIAATVTTNTTYNVTLKSDQPNLTATGVSTEITASSDVAAGNNAWGIKKDGAYAALTTTATEFDSTTEDDASIGSHKHTWDIGISTAATIPTGTYSTDIIVTANSN